MRTIQRLLKWTSILIVLVIFCYQTYIIFWLGGFFYMLLGIILFPLSPLVPLFFIPMYGTPFSLPGAVFALWVTAFLMMYVARKIEKKSAV